MESSWLEAALSPPHAFGPPPGTGTLRASAEDFVVEEELGFAPDGAGHHLLLKVRKRDANTEWVARQLGRALGCPGRDIGFAGLKDRHAVAEQWFSVPAAKQAREIMTGFAGEGFQVLEVHGHGRKLPRGALAGNRFRIRVRGVTAPREAIAARLARIAREGVPNYFGPQRFGREGSNLARLASGSLPRPRDPGFAFVLSAARSLVFNAVLAQRVRAGSWSRLEAGDLANLDGRGSVFAVEAPTPDLARRIAEFDIHPTGPMWGAGDPSSAGEVQRFEQSVAAGFPAACALAVESGLRQERRSLRLAVRDLAHEFTDDGFTVGFRLGKGSFATAVLRELFDAQPGAQDAGE